MVGMLRALLLAIAIASQASFARAQAPDEPVTFHGLTFPANIAGAERLASAITRRIIPVSATAWAIGNPAR